MKVLLINSVCGVGSTGRICTEIAEELISRGDTVKIAYGRSSFVPEEFKKYAVKIGNGKDVKLHVLKTRFTDGHGFGSERATENFLKRAEEFNPDVLWLHNIHGYYINIRLLFDWIKSRPNMQVKWTLHDCWAFTGHCAHFDYAKCEKWQSGCGNCPISKNYPKSYVDKSRKNYLLKKAIFTGVKNLTVIVPSLWLKNLTEKSFLKEYPIEVVRNKIDRTVFKPTESDFKNKYGLNNKKIILGVASVWDKRKGYEDFIKLSSVISDDYRIVLVGLTDKQLKKLPDNIIGIEKTNSTSELAAIYTAADVFVNLTYEDNYPTVNLEAQACGTPCITYRTGGSPESVPDNNVAEKGDIEKVVDLIKNYEKLEIFDVNEL